MINKIRKIVPFATVAVALLLLITIIGVLKKEQSGENTTRPTVSSDVVDTPHIDEITNSDESSEASDEPAVVGSLPTEEIPEEPDIIDNGDGSDGIYDTSGDLYKYLTTDCANTVAATVPKDIMGKYSLLVGDLSTKVAENTLNFSEYKLLSSGMYVLVLVDDVRYYSLYTDGDNINFSSVYKEYYQPEE